MRIFLDSSVLLTASGSSKGTSFAIVSLAKSKHWELLTSDYCVMEVIKNLPKLKGGLLRWQRHIQPCLSITHTATTTRYPTLLSKAKDKPVLFSALAYKADCLLTLDSADFGILMNTKVYGTIVTTPWVFLEKFF